MRLRCRLKEFRLAMRTEDGESVSLREIEERCGASESGGSLVSNSVLSMLEQGRILPKDNQIAALEEAYGHPFEEWYAAGDDLYAQRVMLVLQPDREAA